jgi:hypothetical protein
MRTETLSGPSLDVYLEAVELWPEPLLKEIVGFQSPIQADTGDGDSEASWDDQP